MAVQDADNGVSKDMGTNDHLDQIESQKEGFMEETARVVDHPAERALCFKFDIRILPVLAVMCKSPTRCFDAPKTRRRREKTLLNKCHCPSNRISS